MFEHRERQGDNLSCLDGLILGPRGKLLPAHTERASFFPRVGGSCRMFAFKKKNAGFFLSNRHALAAQDKSTTVTRVV